MSRPWSVLPLLLRDVGLLGLTLLLALGPFIHGHLGPPRQFGWHVHVQATAPVVVSTTGDALAQPAESPDVELAPSLAARRLLPALPAAPDFGPVAIAGLLLAPVPVIGAAARALLPLPLPPSSASRGHLRPPPQAPPKVR